MNQDDPDAPRSAPDHPREALGTGSTESLGSAPGQRESIGSGPSQTIGEGPNQTIGNAPATNRRNTGLLVGGGVALLAIVAIIIGFVAR